MATSANAKMMVETGQSYKPPTVMADSGDNTVFTVAGGPVFSGRSGFEPVIRPNGIVTGINLLSPNPASDQVDVAPFTAYSKGVERSVDAATVTITRPATDVARVLSITMTEAGAVEAVAGTDATDTAFSETRGAAGGPPEIPADSVEIGQVRINTAAAGVIKASEIFQVPGTHAERYDLPSFVSNNIGQGTKAKNPAKENAYVEFADALPAVHTTGTTKRVYIEFYAPIFAEVQRAVDFVPAENTHSVSSTQIYGGTVGSPSSSLGQGSFTAFMNDNVTDALVGLRDERLTFKFFPDKNRSPHILTQGIMGMGRTFPAGDQNKAAITISADEASADFAA